MNSKEDILDISRHSFEGDFDTQVEELLYHVRLTASEVQTLRTLYMDLEQTLQCLAPGLQVLPFGSIVTGLGIKTSDVDCYIQLPESHKPNSSYVIYARNILRRHYRKFTNLFAITTAKVPIVKFLHIPTNCNCDVNFKSPAGVRNSELICTLLRMDRSDKALKLAILVKYWSKVLRITGTNLLASYALILMVIFYLQLMNILPSILEMQRDIPPDMVDNWNTVFKRNMECNRNNEESLYELLGGFFKCYSNLKFEENLISPYMGRLFNKNQFKKLNEVPEEFSLYKDNVSAGICKPINVVAPICIQDPFELSRNCAAGVHARLALKIKAHFQFAAAKYEELPPEQFLEAILTQDPTTGFVKGKGNKAKAPPPKPYVNKVQKQKHYAHVKKHALYNNGSLLKCFEQFTGNQRRK